MPEEVDPEMLLDFIAEARPGLDQVEHDLLMAERDPGARIDCLDRVFRTMHSIKGNGGFLGLRILVQLAHEAETVMDAMRNGRLELSSHIMDAIFAATDKLLFYIDLADHGQLTISNDEAAGTAIDPAAEIKALQASMGTLPTQQTSLVEHEPTKKTLRSAENQASVHNTQVEPENRRHETEPIDLPHKTGDTAQAPLTSKHANHSTTSPSTPRTQTVSRTSSQTRTGTYQNLGESDPNATVRVNARFLDDLLAFTGNMVMARNQLLTRYNFQGDQSFATLSRSITDVHKGVVQQRMQTVGVLFGRFHRVVRDLAKKLGKEVDLTIEGEDIELDRTIMDAFTDPLTHMVRNSMDHGLESPEARMAAGKSRVGRLILRAYHQSGEVIVEIEDDGAGINIERVAQKAIEKGIVTAEQIADWKPRDLTQLIFEPGFSTKETASEYSGRGVGMDVVRVNIEKIGGNIEVHTDPGKGSLFAFSLPLTQAVVSSSLMSALVVEVNGQHFAIPETGINEIIRVNPQLDSDRIEGIEGRNVYRLRDRVLSIVHLEDALDLPRTYIDKNGQVQIDRRQRIADRRSSESQALSEKMASQRSGKDRRRTSSTLIVINFRKGFFGIMVDRVIGIEEVVVRGSPKLVENVSTFSGHTVLGDGTVVMMVDIHGIVDKMGLEFNDEEAPPSNSHRALRTAQQMIVFNNAPTEYFAVPLMMITLIERISADEIHKVGSREYYHFKNSTIPILRLEDHLDVSTNRDASEYHLLLPARLNKPIGLLAGTDLSVEDFSDAFDSNVDNGIGLIGTAFRDERLIMLLDLYALFEAVAPENFQSSQKAAHNKNKAKILLAEDNQFFAKLITSYLEQPHIDLTVVSDGQEAWDLLIKERKIFDLIVSDIEMPRMNGFDLVRNIKNNPDTKHTPVLALTSLADQDSRARGLKAGFDEYAVKIDKEELLDMVFGEINKLFIGQGDS